jgi:hypothetical protein
MEAFLSSNGPYAPRSALEHPTVSRVFANIKCIPRDPFTKFSKNAPAKRFVHKKRKLTPQDPQPKRLNTAPQQRQRPRQQKHDKAGKSGTQASTQSLSSKDRDESRAGGLASPLVALSTLVSAALGGKPACASTVPPCHMKA